MPITAVIADDHDLIRQGIRQILESNGMSILAEARDGLETIALLRNHQPDLLTLDLAMPYSRGIEVFVEARRWSPGTKVIVFSGLTSARLLASLAASDANGIFLKREDLSAFSNAIPRIIGGETLHGPGVADLIAQTDNSENLTAREQQILSLVAQGLANREIADRLGVSAKTVDNHRTNLMRKIGVHSLAELLAYAMREGLLDANHET